MQQGIIDMADARAKRDAGMLQAMHHAQDEDAEWPDVAYAFLVRYARTHEFFMGWECTAEANRLGYGSPTTSKSWGALYTKAQREGVIAKFGSGNDPHRHASICPRYRSLVFVGVPA